MARQIIRYQGELWSEIPGHHGKYFASRNGQILSLAKSQSKPRVLRQIRDGEYSAADVVVLYAAYKNYVTKHTTYCNLLKKWIKRETDNAVIGAIQYGDNLPEDLTAQMKTILDAATAQLTSITTAVSDGAFADKISSLENQMTETQMALCDVYEQVIAVTSATEG